MWSIHVCCIVAGDIVSVREAGPEQGHQVSTGVVVHVTQLSIRIAIDDDIDELDTLSDDAQLHLYKLSNDVCAFR